MIDLSHIPETPGLRVFLPQSVDGNSWQTWQKPRGFVMASIYAIGPGGGGAKAEGISRVGDAAQAFDARQVDDGARQRLADMGGVNVGAAPQRQRPGRGHGTRCFLDRPWPGVHA